MFRATMFAAVTALASVTTTSAVFALSVTAPTCDVKLTTQDNLGNFDIQMVVIIVEEISVNGMKYIAETLTFPVGSERRAKGKINFAIKSPCAVRRKMKIRTTGKDSGDSNAEYALITPQPPSTSALSVDLTLRIDR